MSINPDLKIGVDENGYGYISCPSREPANQTTSGHTLTLQVRGHLTSNGFMTGWGYDGFAPTKPTSYRWDGPDVLPINRCSKFNLYYNEGNNPYKNVELPVLYDVCKTYGIPCYYNSNSDNYAARFAIELVLRVQPGITISGFRQYKDGTYLMEHNEYFQPGIYVNSWERKGSLTINGDAPGIITLMLEFDGGKFRGTEGNISDCRTKYRAWLVSTSLPLNSIITGPINDPAPSGGTDDGSSAVEPDSSDSSSSDSSSSDSGGTNSPGTPIGPSGGNDSSSSDSSSSE